MQKASLIKWVIGSLWAVSACNSPASTLLDQAIDSAKSRQAAELARKEPTTSTSDHNIKISSAPPQLWALAGINDALTAEVLYQGKVARVPLKKGARVHVWRVTSYDNQGISFGGKASAKRYLPAAYLGSSVDPYLDALNPPADSSNSLPQNAASNLPLPPRTSVRAGDQP